MPIRLLVLILFQLVFSHHAIAQQALPITKIDASTVPREIVLDTREKAVDGLPDGRIAVGGEKATIAKAWYSRPTSRYPHGILGDKVEGGSLVVLTRRGLKLKYQLRETEVFEDVTPRLADLDGDGKTEIITIQSSLILGASVAIFQVNGETLIRQAQSNYIGRPNRWLNIAGISNYTGHSTPEIAIVVTPHIGGQLELHKFFGGRLVRLFAERGFSNHFIGSNEQRLSASFLEADKSKIGLALPSADRRSLMIMSVGPTGWLQKAIAKFPAKIDKAIGVEGTGKNTKFTVGLSDGSVYEVNR